MTRDLLAIGMANVRQKIWHENWDYLTVCDGYEGSGKSTLALKIAMLTDPEFRPERQVAFEVDELLELLRDTRTGVRWCSTRPSRAPTPARP